MDSRSAAQVDTERQNESARRTGPPFVRPRAVVVRTQSPPLPANACAPTVHHANTYAERELRLHRDHRLCPSPSCAPLTPVRTNNEK